MTDRVRLVRGDTVTPQPITWYWRDWLARGKFELLAGTKGDGKSTLAGDLAARISCGGKWPDGSPVAEVGSTLVWSSEDAFDDTILPRFLAAGGDGSRLYHVAGIYNGNGYDRYFDPTSDMLTLQREATSIPDLRLMIIDPVVSAVTGDGNNNPAVRQSLQPIVNLAGQLGCTALGITHFNKASQRGKHSASPLDRINGSLAYGAVARVVMGTVTGQNGAPNRLVRVASNIAPTGGGFEYLLEQAPVPGHNFNAQRVEWVRALSGSPDALMSHAKDTKIERAKAWLLERLQGGPMLERHIEAALKGMGEDFSMPTVRNAKGKLPISAEKTADGWVWRLWDPDKFGKMKAA